MIEILSSPGQPLVERPLDEHRFVEQSFAEHVVAARVSGKLETSDIDAVTNAIDAKLEQHERIALYMELDEMAGFTLDALLKDVRYGLRRLKDMKRFARAALVTDKRWLSTVARWENKAFPGIEIRPFSTAEAARAKQWVSELGVAERV